MYGCLPQNLLMFILLLVLTTVAVIRASSPVSTSPPGILIPDTTCKAIFRGIEEEADVTDSEGLVHWHS